MTRGLFRKIAATALMATGPLAGLAATTHPREAQAAPSAYKAARSKFSNGDIQGAEKTLKSLLGSSSRISGKDLEEARKLLGVCHYLQGQNREAEAVFLQVLRENPQAKLQSEDLLDPSVAGLFEQVRAKVKAQGRSGTPPRSSAATAEVSKSAPKGMTGIEVQTNAKRATIFDAGIFVGTTGLPITLDPGRHELTISSEGYEDVSKTVVLQSGQVLKLNVVLRKPAPPAPPPAKVAQPAQRVPSNDGDLGTKKKKTQMDYSGDLPGPKAGASLADEFFRDSQRSVQPQPPPPRPVAPRAVTPAPAYRQPAYQQPQVPQPTYQQPPPAAQQPTYSQPVYQQPTYAAPTYQQPAYQQPAYPQPTYQQPNYAQPTYQQPTYQQPAYEQPAYQQPTYAEPTYPARATPTPSRAPVKKVSRSGGRSVLLALLPFGAGQFQNGDYLKGVLFVGAEGGGIGWALYSWKREQDFIKLEQAAMANDDATKPDTLLDNYPTDSSKTYKNSQRMNQYVGWGIFGVSWVVGMIDAIANIDNPPSRRNAALEVEPTPPGAADSPTFRWGTFAYDKNGIGLRLDLRF